MGADVSNECAGRETTPYLGFPPLGLAPLLLRLPRRHMPDGPRLLAVLCVLLRLVHRRHVDRHAERDAHRLSLVVSRLADGVDLGLHLLELLRLPEATLLDLVCGAQEVQVGGDERVVRGAFVRGGDGREGDERARVGSLGVLKCRHGYEHASRSTNTRVCG